MLVVRFCRSCEVHVKAWPKCLPRLRLDGGSSSVTQVGGAYTPARRNALPARYLGVDANAPNGKYRPCTEPSPEI